MIALSVAIVLVALVARDVVLRLHDKRARAADIDEVRAEGRQGRCDIENRATAQDAAIAALVGECAGLRRDIGSIAKNAADGLETIKAEVQVLKTNASLRGKL